MFARGRPGLNQVICCYGSRTPTGLAVLDRGVEPRRILTWGWGDEMAG